MTTHQDAKAPSDALPSYVFVLPWDLKLTGGVNQVVINLHREMSAAGELQPLVLVSRWEAFRPVEKIIDGRPTVYLRLWAPMTEGGSIVGLVKWILSSPVWIFDLVRFCRRHRVIAFNFHFAGLTAFPIALLRFLRLYRGALIVSFHGADLTNARGGGRMEGWLWRFVLHSASSVVACSEALAQDVREFVGDGADRVGAIQNGLDINHFLENVQRATALHPVLRNREFVLSVATWEEKKGLDTLLRAFAEVKRIVSGIALVLIGRSGC
ncbi:MAG: hypothetical protein AUG50_00295 [Betaproteobacteria bacterium 13_1_20CM_3_63_8]|nr:MAG: hypothetical protein AUG50_00295 [Betaproteobacteria bacterium 13_1_20CM_3_63_8]